MAKSGPHAWLRSFRSFIRPDVLTFIEAISLAGDRKKQNDDAYGFAGARAWVLDGATDMHGAPLTGWATDASWIAHFANRRLHAADLGADMREVIRDVSTQAAAAFSSLSKGAAFEKWQSPISSLLMIEETPDGVRGLDLGDSRIFALDVVDAVHAAGGVIGGRDAEADAASKQTDADKPLLERTATIDMLVDVRHRPCVRRSCARLGVRTPASRTDFADDRRLCGPRRPIRRL
jgi:hypothetical protein